MARFQYLERLARRPHARAAVYASRRRSAALVEPTKMTTLPISKNTPEQIAEARRRTPSLSDAQWLAWLASLEAHEGRLLLTFDGECFADYPRQSATPADSQ